MADQKVSDLPALNGANVDPADLLYIVDSSAGTAGSKKITIGQFQIAPVSGGTANAVLYLDASKVQASGANLTFDGTQLGVKSTILETVYTITDGAAFEIDPGNGSVQLITLGASRTPKATNFAAGEAITLMVDDGSAYTITWTDATWGGSGVVWMTGGGTAPTLNTSGYTTIVLWKVSTQVYGAKVG